MTPFNQRKRHHFVFASISLPTTAPDSSGCGHDTDLRLLNFASLSDENCPDLLSSLHSSATPVISLGQQRKEATSTDVHSAQPVRRFPRHHDSSRKAGKSRNVLRTVKGEEVNDESNSLCVESTSGRKRIYRPHSGEDDCGAWEGFDILEEQQTHQGRMKALVQSYLLPQGYPDSVAPQYASYMGWRGVQYFFGGAISVYTTKSLLGALGVAGKYSGEASAAINWVIKDGAGRLGRLLFARWGRELDCELKQFRLAGDLLMEAGAALELATIYAPPAFLPLACTANLAKNLAAVAASSTRAPIYRTFALSNNLADITAKGESVANLADIAGTIFGIVLSRGKLPLFPTFCCLSLGYLVASRFEVDSVELPYLNRARMAYSTKRFLADGEVPGIPEANHKEPLLPWGRHNQQRMVLGARVEQASGGPSDLRFAMQLSGAHRYVVTYRPDTKKVYILLKEGAQNTECLRAVFSAHLFLHLHDQDVALHPAWLETSSSSSTSASTPSSKSKHPQKQSASSSSSSSTAEEVAGWKATLLLTQQLTDKLYPEFERQAVAQGWKLQQTMLNPKETRLVKVMQPLL